MIKSQPGNPATYFLSRTTLVVLRPDKEYHQCYQCRQCYHVINVANVTTIRKVFASPQIPSAGTHLFELNLSLVSSFFYQTL